MFSIMGLNSFSEPIKDVSQIDTGLQEIMDTCIRIVAGGTMVISLTSPSENQIKVASAGESGYIVYAKPILKISNSLEDILEELKENTGTSEFAYVLRYKRRQNKWYLHMGMHTTSMPKENPKFKVYSLDERSHIQTKGGDE